MEKSQKPKATAKELNKFKKILRAMENKITFLRAVA
jgi:hypothetical protein